MDSNLVLYEDVPAYDSWTKYIIGGIIALTLIMGIVFIPFDIVGAIVLFAVMVFDAVLFWIILPKRFQVFEDRVKIVLGGPFSINIPFSDIAQVSQASGDKAYIYWGLRLGTSNRHLVEIERRHGLSVIISPANNDMFMKELNRIRQTWSDLNGS